MDPDWLINWSIDRSVWSTCGSVSFTISQWLYCSRINIVTVDAKCHTLKANASLNTFPPFSLVCTVPSRREGEGGTNYRDPGPNCVAYVFVFCGNILCNDVVILSCWRYSRPAAILRWTLLSAVFIGVYSAIEGEGEGGTNYRDQGPDCVAYVFVFCGNILCDGVVILSCWRYSRPAAILRWTLSVFSHFSPMSVHPCWRPRGLNPLSAALGVYLGLFLCACALMSQDYQEEMSGKVCCDGARIFQMRSLFFLYMFDVNLFQLHIVSLQTRMLGIL